MTEEYQPTMLTWKMYVTLAKVEQQRVMRELSWKAIYGGLDIERARKYSTLAKILETDDIKIFAEDPDLLRILHVALNND